MISLASGFNEASATLFHEKRTNADANIGSRLRGDLLYSDPLIRPTTAQHASPLPKPVLRVHRVEASTGLAVVKIRCCFC